MKTLRLVLVDDNRAERELAAEAAKEFGSGLKLRTAASHDEAMRLLKEERLPHLVLVDLHLGGRSGRELVRQVRLLPKADYLPVVVCTNGADDGEKERCLAVGAWEVWNKPDSYADFTIYFARARELALKRAATTSSAHPQR